MNDVTSALSFRNYKVSKISFELNNDYKPEENNKMIDLDYSISSAKRIIDNNLIIQLSVKIFENMKEDNKPFTMEVVMDGIFTVTNNNDNIDYEKNAIAIMYPYIRSVVSTYTSMANVPPLMLPVINVNKYLENRTDK